MIIIRTPVRLSFGGGGTDLPSYYNKHDGMVVSTTINRYFYTLFNPRKDDKVQIYSSDLNIHEFFDSPEEFYEQSTLTVPRKILNHYSIEGGFDLILSSDVPPFAGLGGSSSLTVSLVKLCSELTGNKLFGEALAEEAHKMRTNVLQLPAGRQDEYAAAFGGFNVFKFHKDKVFRKKMVLPKSYLDKLNEYMLLFHTGIRRNSTNILETMNDDAESSEKSICVDALHKVKSLGYQIVQAIEDRDFLSLGGWLNESWKEKKKFSKGVSNEFIDKMYDTAIRHGAYGGKVTGAGGGGFMMFLAPGHKHDKIIKNLSKHGMALYDFKFEDKGTEVIHND